MKPGYYFVVLLLAVACVVLTVTLILMARVNQRLQVQLQAQQQALNQGILGQQAQQISGGVLQDLAGAAVGNMAIRELLEKHGYRVPPARPPKADTPGVAGGSPRAPGSVMNLPKKKREESTNTVALQP